jgi:hypothetical protein
MATATKTRKSTKKTSAKKTASKSKASPKKAPAKKKTYKDKGMTAKEMHAERASKPIVWSERRIAVVKAMKQLGAKNASTAVSAEDILKASKLKNVDVKTIKVHLDTYRGAELLAQGYAKSVRHEGQRALSYFLTAKGVKAKFS